MIRNSAFRKEVSLSWQEDFIKYLYPEDLKKVQVERAFMLKYRHLPPKIYRYTSASVRNIKALDVGAVWLCNPCNYNDPYDSAFGLSLGAITRKSLKDSSFDKLCQKFPDFAKVLASEKKQILEADDPFGYLAECLIKNSKDEDMKKEYRFVLRTILRKYNEDFINRIWLNARGALKVCSFTTRIDSLLMWSHYADEHQGICVEFDTKKYEYNDNRSKFLFPVIYTDKLLDITDLYTKNHPNLNRWQLTSLMKAKDWAYEEEWRLVYAYGILAEEQSILMGTPSALYLGNRIVSEKQKWITKIAQDRGIPLRKMALSRTEYSMEARNPEDADPNFFRD